MARFVVGEVVVVNFPFSNLKGQKLRPALVVAQSEFNDLILCQITSKAYSSQSAIKLTSKDFTIGKLPIISYIRPDKLFTTDPLIIVKSVGQLKDGLLDQVISQLIKLFSQ